MLRLVLILLLVFFSKSALAQTGTIESLKKRAATAITTKDKLNAILELCDQGYSLHPDTLMAYAEQAGNIASTQKNNHHKIRALYYQSFALTTKGLIDSSLAVANHCLQLLSNNIEDPVLLANVLNQKGRCYMRKNQYKEAIEMGYRVIDEAEKAKDTILQMKGKTLIGWAYLEMGQSHEALRWHLKALNTTRDTLVQQKYSVLFGNLAINYSGLQKTDSAFYYIERSVKYARKHENLFALSNALAMQAQLYVKAGKPKMAETPLKEVVEIRKLIGDPFYIVSDMSQLALYYAHNGQQAKGIALCNEGIEIANRYKLGTKLFFLYSSLAENYKAMGDNSMYASILEKIIDLKDSVYQANSAEALAEMQAKYDLQKKENTIIQQELALVSKNYWLYGSVMVSLLSLALAVMLFKYYRRKQKMKVQLMMQEEKRIASEAVVRAEENERKRIAADLHDNMGAYASAISANVDDMMMSKNTIDSTVLQSMKNNAAEIMVNLRDTIWVLNKEAIYITGISDRFKSYVQKIGSSYPAIKIEIKENITNDISLSPENALNMIRIMQEAFHNALKHSKCSQISIEIISDKNLQLRITDDGTGILTGEENIGGNGLQNMQSRAKANGWTLRIKHKEPKGTLVELTA